ncbi:MAG TPA: hypothetical protein VNI77_01510 [Nitrososphaera sp.]|nr:hypothetical protein [Nitrososphaera sp.]
MKNNNSRTKKKNVLNRIIIRSGVGFFVQWKCDICSSLHRTLKELKSHKKEIHAY